MQMDFSSDLIKWFISTFGYKNYLEIGCCDNYTFSRVTCERMVGVDPEKGGTLRMTSDEFFSTNEETFDIIFIDGDHHHTQVLKDVENALLVLNEGGTIVMHDCNPPTLEMERPAANGTAWRAFTVLRTRQDLAMATFNFNHGLGVIRRGRNEDPLVIEKTMDELTFNDLDQNRQTWLNLLGRSTSVLRGWVDQIQEIDDE